jgi:hypothetical protein
MVGSTVTMVGRTLFFQNTVDYFRSWVYAWALVFPTSVGVGRFTSSLTATMPTAGATFKVVRCLNVS